MRVKQPLLAFAFLIFSVSLIAQNNPALKNIDKAYLKQCLLQHKNIHFVFANDPRNPVQFYETSPQEAIPQQSMQVNTMTSLQSNFHLVKDINKQTDANPINNDFFTDFNNTPFAILNGIMYFSADDGIHGAQLWRSDGTSAGTFAVTNLDPGFTSVNEIVTTANKLYFVTSGVTIDKYQLFVSDGTSAGTLSLKDIDGIGPGVNGSHYLTAVGNSVYFFISYNYNPPQLWRTGGTVASTKLVRDFTNLGQEPYLPTKANGLFYFTIYTNANGRELWRSDGTDAGTFMLKDISSSIDSYEGPLQLTAFKNKLYFSADDGTGRRLWLTDGTTTGTVPASNTNDVYLIDDFIFSIVNTPFTVVENNFYTEATSSSTGAELYKYNITQGFKLIKDITAGINGGSISSILSFNGGIAFIYWNLVDNSTQLYTSTGSVGNITLIQSYSDQQSHFKNLSAVNNVLYFDSYSINAGIELWKCSDIANSVMLVKDIYLGKTSSNPNAFTIFNGKIYFNAASENSGTELWQTAGTEASTFMVKEINNTSSAGSSVSYSAIYGLYNTTPAASINDEIFFVATKPETGYELYKSDGKTSETGIVKNIAEGQENSNPQYFISKQKNVYFLTQGKGAGIYKTDSSNTVTQLISSPGGISSFDVADNGLVFYIKYNSITGNNELWRSDGTESGNFFLTDKQYSNSLNMVVTAGNNAYFSASDDNGIELWKSNGHVSGTKMIKDINAGAASSSPYDLYAFNRNIYFGANDGSGIASLWRSNGTEAGTIKLKDIKPFDASVYAANYTGAFCAIKSKLYISASSLENGKELWKTDGTANGTVLVKDISPGTESSSPFNLTNVNENLFFFTNSNTLYKSNGTEKGTVVVKVILESEDYLYNERCVSDGKFFFNPDGVLWASDGTDSGTYQVNDKGLQNVSDVKNLVAAGNTIFFDGYTDKYGSELYAGDATQVITKNIANTQSVKRKPVTFTASILQNPVSSLLYLSIKSFITQTLHLVISNERGNIIAQQNLFVNKDINNVSFSATNW